MEFVGIWTVGSERISDMAAGIWVDVLPASYRPYPNGGLAIVDTRSNCAGYYHMAYFTDSYY